MTEITTAPLEVGDRVRLASGVTPEVGTVQRTGVISVTGEEFRRVGAVEVIWPIGSVPETTAKTGVSKWHFVEELQALTSWDELSQAVGLCDDCHDSAPDLCLMHSALCSIVEQHGDRT